MGFVPYDSPSSSCTHASSPCLPYKPAEAPAGAEADRGCLLLLLLLLPKMEGRNF